MRSAVTPLVLTPFVPFRLLLAPGSSRPGIFADLVEKSRDKSSIKSLWIWSGLQDRDAAGSAADPQLHPGPPGDASARQYFEYKTPNIPKARSFIRDEDKASMSVIQNTKDITSPRRYSALPYFAKCLYK